VIANAGTPLIWAGAIHLFAGNLFIGVAEGVVFARLAKCSYGVSALCLVVANYLSTWLGLLWLFNPQLGFWDHITIENLREMLALQVGVAFCATLLVEFPLAWLASRWVQKAEAEAQARTQRSLRAPGFVSVVRGHFLTQAVSYLVLFNGYWCLSETSVMAATVVSAEDLLPAGVAIFFISEDGRQVYRQNSTTSDPTRITELQAVSNQHSLLMAKGEEEWQVVLSRPINNGNDNLTVKVLASGFPKEKCPLLASGHPLCWPQRPSDPAPRLGASLGEWHYFGDSWGYGLTARKLVYEEPGVWRPTVAEEHRIAISSPLLGWVAHEVTTLPNQMALFRFGPSQICLYDPETNRIALFAKGRSVLAVLE
jgi:hypothetical protein